MTAAVSGHIAEATRGVDLSLGLKYTPPEGESRVGLTIVAYLIAERQRRLSADTVTFNPTTGEIVATWQEATTDQLVPGVAYDARFIRERDGQSRHFYTRPVNVL